MLMDIIFSIFDFENYQKVESMEKCGDAPKMKFSQI